MHLYFCQLSIYTDSRALSRIRNELFLGMLRGRSLYQAFRGNWGIAFCNQQVSAVAKSNDTKLSSTHAHSLAYELPRRQEEMDGHVVNALPN